MNDHVVGVVVDEHLGGGALLDDLIASVIVVVLGDVVATVCADVLVSPSTTTVKSASPFFRSL